jgi:hypothetical protein
MTKEIKACERHDFLSNSESNTSSITTAPKQESAVEPREWKRNISTATISINDTIRGQQSFYQRLVFAFTPDD